MSPPDIAPTYAPTFTALYREVLAPNCAPCHNTGSYSLATRAVAYQSLVNAPASTTYCKTSGLVRVAPGNPSASLLYLKVTTPPCGVKMPPLVSLTQPLDSKVLNQMSEWISLGAPDN